MESRKQCTSWKQGDVCKLEVYNAWFYRCKVHAEAFDRPNAPAYITKEQYWQQEEVKRRIEDEE